MSDSLTTLTDCPSSIYAGETVLFEIALDDYPSGTWTLRYDWRAPNGSEIQWVGGDDNGNHLISVDADSTASYAPAVYMGVAVVTNGSQQRVVWRGQLEVLADLSVQPANYDSRSWAKRCLDKIEEVIEGRASKDVMSSSIAGQFVARLTPQQLFDLRDKFKAEYEREVSALDVEHGETAGRNIVMRFNNASY